MTTIGSPAVPDIDCLMPIGPGPQSWADVAVESILDQVGVSVRLIIILDQRNALPDSLAGLEARKDVLVVDNRRSPGISGALNTGLGLSQTPVVARMDSDDIAASERLKCQLAVMRAAHAVVVGSSVHYFQGKVMDDWDRKDVGVNACEYSYVTPRSLMSENTVAHPSVVMDRAQVLAAGGYNEDARRVEDYELWLRLCLAGPIATVACPLVAVRGHDQQHSRGRPIPRDQWILAQRKVKASMELTGGPWSGIRGIGRYYRRHARLAAKRRARS